MPKVKQFDETCVLGKAKEVFCEKGYNGTSMDDLVKATGLSRSSIYDTFSDKHGLFLRVLHYYQCNNYNNLQPKLDQTDSPVKKINIVFDNAVQDILEDKEGKGCLLINASMELSCVDKEVSCIANTNMEAMEENFRKWIEEGQSKGEIARHFTPAEIARHLFNSLAGLRITGRQRPDVASLRDTVKVALFILNK